MAHWRLRTKNLKNGAVGIYARRRDSNGERWVNFHQDREAAEAWCEAENVRERQARTAPPVPVAAPVVPTIAEYAKTFLDSADVKHRYARTTLHDHTRYLRPGGPILAHLGALRLDEIERRHLKAWWKVAVTEAGRSASTGRNWTNTLAALLAEAEEDELVPDTANPIPGFRRSRKRFHRTQRGRAEREAQDTRHPIADPRDLDRLLEAAQHEGDDVHTFVLLMLDAGLRYGEACALRWGSVHWGAGPEDMNRHLFISESCSRGGPVGPTKSGKSSPVLLSQRLWRQLRRRYNASVPRPEPDAFILPRALLHQSNFTRRPGSKQRQRGPWARILERAGIATRHTPKDLRSSCASTLETAGIPLGEIQRHLRHSDPSVTRGHYAIWLGGARYIAPVVLRRGELPPDLIARAAEWWPPQAPDVEGEWEGERATGDALPVS